MLKTRTLSAILGALVLAPLAASQCIGAGGFSSLNPGDAFPIPNTQANQGLIALGTAANKKMLLGNVPMYVSMTFFDACSVEGFGVILGQPLANVYLQASVQSNNPSIFGVGFGWIVCHEFGHHFCFKYLGLNRSVYASGGRYWENMADLLGAYLAASVLKDQLDSRRISGSLREDAIAEAQKIVTDTAFSIGQGGFFDEGKHGKKRQRQDAAIDGFRAGIKGTYGSDFSQFRNSGEGFKWADKCVKSYEATQSVYGFFSSLVR